jgi:hypothetical protein
LQESRESFLKYISSETVILQKHRFNRWKTDTSTVVVEAFMERIQRTNECKTRRIICDGTFIKIN